MRVAGDADRLGRVVSNLVSNALRHGAGDVEVRVAGGAEVVVEVSDEGPGFAEERPFERFAGSHGSVGLGLAIVDEIVRAHGGRVEIAREDGRTIVRVTLPALGRPEAESADADGVVDQQRVAVLHEVEGDRLLPLLLLRFALLVLEVELVLVGVGDRQRGRDRRRCPRSWGSRPSPRSRGTQGCAPGSPPSTSRTRRPGRRPPFRRTTSRTTRARGRRRGGSLGVVAARSCRWSARSRPPRRHPGRRHRSRAAARPRSPRARPGAASAASGDPQGRSSALGSRWSTVWGSGMRRQHLGAERPAAPAGPARR